MDDFLRLLADTPVNMDEWHRQRAIYEGDDGENNFHSPLEVGFATFFLNRTNCSGIIKKAGLIGRADQSGKYKMDRRFNKADLARRIERIASKAADIEMHNEDTLAFIAHNRQRLSDTHSFMYLDPPYYMNGSSLYLNAYSHQDHANLRDLMAGIRNMKWMISYDDVPGIRELYDRLRTTQHKLSYFLQDKRKTEEYFIYSDALLIG